MPGRWFRSFRDSVRSSSCMNRAAMRFRVIRDRWQGSTGWPGGDHQAGAHQRHPGAVNAQPRHFAIGERKIPCAEDDARRDFPCIGIEPWARRQQAWCHCRDQCDRDDQGDQRDAHKSAPIGYFGGCIYGQSSLRFDDDGSGAGPDRVRTSIRIRCARPRAVRHAAMAVCAGLPDTSISRALASDVFHHSLFHRIDLGS
jgi:hypothetical protein